MPSKQNLPEGKIQFGAVIPSVLHKAAVAMASERGVRFSDVYADGIRALIKARSGGGVPEGATPKSEEIEFVKQVTDGIDRKYMVYILALAEFLRKGNHDSYNFGILKMILGNYLPADKIVDHGASITPISARRA